MVAWLSKRVGTPLNAPDFDKQGFRLLGGRLLAGETGPVAQFMYQDGIERRVTLYVRRTVLDGQETAFRHATIDGVDVFYWIAWLASHPEDAARVQAWAGHTRALHATFDGVLNEPLPLDLVRATRRRTAPAAFVAAAAMLAMVISGLVGYAIGTQREQAPVVLARTSDLARDAALAHAVFSPEARHPVEVDAAHADHL